MILKEYAIYDRVAGEYVFTFKAQNDGLMIRNVKSGMLGQQANPLNTDTEDKDIYCLAEFDTKTGLVKGFVSPEFVTRLEEVREELIKEYKKKKLEATEVGAPVPEDPKIIKDGEKHE